MEASASQNLNPHPTTRIKTMIMPISCSLLMPPVRDCHDPKLEIVDTPLSNMCDLSFSGGMCDRSFAGGMCDCSFAGGMCDCSFAGDMCDRSRDGDIPFYHLFFLSFIFFKNYTEPIKITFDRHQVYRYRYSSARAPRPDPST